MFDTGQIPDATLADTVDAFRRFRATCDRLAVQHIRAIATSAMRDARNRDLLIDRVRDACGIEIEVISGTQEAYLLKLGIEAKVDLRQGRSLLVDVGGGSVEIVLVEDGQVTNADSYRLGALRMLEALRDSETSSESFVDLLHKHMRSLERRILDRFEARDFDRYVAVGGNIDSLTDLIHGRLGAKQHNGVDCCSIQDLDKEVRDLATMTVEQRMERRGLKPDRADTILPAGIVYVRLGQLAGVDRVLAPRVGIKEGLLQEVFRGHFESFAAEDPVDVGGVAGIDVTGDGVDDLILQTTDNDSVWDGGGNSLFSFGYAAPKTTLGDADGDGQEDIIVYYPGDGMSVDIISKGTQKTIATRLDIGDPARVALIRFASGPQIVLADSTGGLLALSLSGQPLWSADFGSEESRGLDDAVVNGQIYLSAANHDGSLAVFDGNGKTLWSNNPGQLRRMRTYDLNGDGTSEIITGGEGGDLSSSITRRTVWVEAI